MTHSANDETFLNLLNSQRELLHRLNMEQQQQKHLCHRQQGQNEKHLVHDADKRRPLKKRASLLGAFGGSFEPIDLKQHSVCRRTSLDLLFSKRFNLLENNDDSTHLTNVDFTAEDPNERALKGCTKRRRSSLGLLTSLVEDESSQMPISCNTTSAPRPVPLVPAVSIDQLQVEPPRAKKTKLSSELLLPAAQFGQVSVVMEGFRQAMEKSAKSQQEIQDWDKKMGLKRSHSKTMRLSSRSRKKLRSIIKKEINSLSLFRRY